MKVEARTRKKFQVVRLATANNESFFLTERFMIITKHTSTNVLILVLLLIFIVIFVTKNLTVQPILFLFTKASSALKQ